MRMKKHNRRDFLRGLGGFTLALPFLSSLGPLQALAQLAPKKRFIAFHHYDGIFEKVWYPTQEPTAANGFTSFAADVFYKQLSQIQRMPDGSLSENFKKDFDSVISKMNLYRGLDIPGGGDHDPCHFLCGMQNYDGSEQEGPQFNGASIDTLISKSSNFYATSPKLRAIRTSEDSGYANGISFERDLITGTATRTPFIKKPIDMFNQIFGDLVTEPAVQNKLASMKITIGDIVLEDYKAKMNDRRISSEDKIRLSNFVDNLQEVQKKLSGMSQPQPVNCQKPTSPFDYTYWTNLTDAQRLDCYYARVDLFAAAIACDLTRVAVLTDRGFLANHDYSHDTPDGRDGQLQFMNYNRRAVQVVSRFVNNLNSMIDDPNTGKTVLDNSLVVWGSEISMGQHHRCESMPLVTFGGAGGAIKTGYYVDYRKRPFVHLANRTDFPAMGRGYSQFLVTAMRSMGLQPAEYNNYGDGGGFGLFSSTINYSNNHYEQYRPFRSQTLPFISNIS